MDNLSSPPGYGRRSATENTKPWRCFIPDAHSLPPAHVVNESTVDRDWSRSKENALDHACSTQRREKRNWIVKRLVGANSTITLLQFRRALPRTARSFSAVASGSEIGMDEDSCALMHGVTPRAEGRRC
jgi:hypothetical protein